MSSRLAASNFFALMIGGMKAPSEGAPNTTIESLSGACAVAGAERAVAMSSAKKPRNANVMSFSRPGNVGWAKAHAGRACPTCAYFDADLGQARDRCAVPPRRWARFALPTLRTGLVL